MTPHRHHYHFHSYSFTHSLITGGVLSCFQRRTGTSLIFLQLITVLFGLKIATDSPFDPHRHRFHLHSQSFLFVHSLTHHRRRLLLLSTIPSYRYIPHFSSIDYSVLQLENRPFDSLHSCLGDPTSAVSPGLLLCPSPNKSTAVSLPFVAIM